jgi:tRNA (Thr-GGU) A37 N-methylase
LVTVQLLSRQGTTLRVRGLDAIDGTPVLDIKPWYPAYDVPQGSVRVPDYVHRLAY